MRRIWRREDSGGCRKERSCDGYRENWAEGVEAGSRQRAKALDAMKLGDAVFRAPTDGRDRSSAYPQRRHRLPGGRVDPRLSRFRLRVFDLATVEPGHGEIRRPRRDPRAGDDLDHRDGDCGSSRLGVAIFLTELCPQGLREPDRHRNRIAGGHPVDYLRDLGSVRFRAFHPAIYRAAVDHVVRAASGLSSVFAGPPYGIGMLTAGFVLAIMVLPFIASVSRDVSKRCLRS